MSPRNAATPGSTTEGRGNNHHDAGNVKTQGTARTGRAWRVIGEQFPPCAGRHQPLVIVRRCPNCSGTHGHRGLGLRRAGCGTTYLVIA